MNPSLINTHKKRGWKIQWINFWWEERRNNEEVCGKQNKEKDNDKKEVQNMKIKGPIKWEKLLKLNVDEPKMQKKKHNEKNIVT